MPNLVFERRTIPESGRVNLSVPLGMKERLEQLRRAKAARSVNRVVVDVLHNYLLSEGI